MSKFNQLSREQLRIENIVDGWIDSELPQDHFDLNHVCSMGIQLNSYSNEVKRHHARETCRLMDDDGYTLLSAYTIAYRVVRDTLMPLYV